MQHTTQKAARATQFRRRSTLDPSMFEDVTFTLSEIRRARAGEEHVITP
jgi:hypothetical protein